MPAVGALIDFAPGGVIRSADVDQNLADIRTVLNTYAVLTDVAKTITVTHTWSASQTFSAGIVVAATQRIYPDGGGDTYIVESAGNQLDSVAGGAIQLRLTATSVVLLASTTGDIWWGKPAIALGGGAAPTLGTIGGSGPSTAAQNSWLRVLDSAGNARFIPIWA